jgi:hypothetical protein
MAQQVSWGKATLLLNQDRFEQGYHHGRRYYFEDCSPEGHPTRPITVSDLLHLAAISDEQGHYQLDDGQDITTFREGVEELVGVLIGYLGGPLLLETPEEQQKRLAEVIIISEAVPLD